jgi:hypothetical protein
MLSNSLKSYLAFILGLALYSCRILSLLVFELKTIDRVKKIKSTSIVLIIVSFLALICFIIILHTLYFARAQTSQR